MAGEGFARHGSTSLNENRKLIKRRKLFDKERSFLNLKNKVFHKDSEGIALKSLSKKERRHYRAKTKRSYAKDIFYTRLIVIIGITLFVIMSFSLYLNTSKRELVIEGHQQTARTTKRLKEYNYYINSGDAWYNQKKYYNAAFQYRLALEVFPKDSIALEKLIQAYDANCFYDQRNCGKSEALMTSFHVN
mmetsp:Transcript_15970/g.23527  ORF Transcript_15970/g.23527 Transcript_15970/m.23527 type:complete len:190 (-) Transcript_15970:631-1200(-)